MPRTCSICGHKDRAKIDAAIVSGQSFRRIAAQFEVRATTVRRHKKHTGQAIVRAAEKREVKLGGSILDQMEQIRLKEWELLGQLEQQGDYRGGVMCLRELRECVLSQGELIDRARGDGNSETIRARMQRAEARERDAEVASREQQRPN